MGPPSTALVRSLQSKLRTERMNSRRKRSDLKNPTQNIFTKKPKVSHSRHASKCSSTKKKASSPSHKNTRKRQTQLPEPWADGNNFHQVYIRNTTHYSRRIAPLIGHWRSQETNINVTVEGLAVADHETLHVEVDDEGSVFIDEFKYIEKGSTEFVKIWVNLDTGERDIWKINETWVFHEGYDCSYDGVNLNKRCLKSSLPKLKRQCILLGGSGFNTNGWIKGDLLPKSEWYRIQGPTSFGLYVRTRKINMEKAGKTSPKTESRKSVSSGIFSPPPTNDSPTQEDPIDSQSESENQSGRENLASPPHLKLPKFRRRSNASSTQCLIAQKTKLSAVQQFLEIRKSVYYARKVLQHLNSGGVMGRDGDEKHPSLKDDILKAESDKIFRGRLESLAKCRV